MTKGERGSRSVYTREKLVLVGAGLDGRRLPVVKDVEQQKSIPSVIGRERAGQEERKGSGGART